MVLSGRTHKFGDYINTDIHASGKYLPLGTSPEEVRNQLLAKFKPDFKSRFQKGDLIIAGRGFGTVSSRMEAVLNLKDIGVAAVVATSIGVLFYRNAINCGLPVIQCPTDGILDGDYIEIYLDNGCLINVSQGLSVKFDPFPENLLRILNDGGLLSHISKNGGYDF